MKVSKKVGLSVILIFLVTVTSILYSSTYKETVGEDVVNQPIYRVNTEEKKVALTFDINWAENDYLYEILDVLKENDVKATFFIMGGWVNYTDENKDKLAKINDDGHEIGNHSYIHPSFTSISQERIVDELKKTDDMIFSVTGVKPTIFRFPSGDYNETALEFVRSLGYECIQWDVDSVDYKQAGEDVEYNRVMKKVKEGSIMLFHNNAKYTPSNLKKIIENLTEEGYEFVTISQLIYTNNYYINENGEQIKNNY